MPGPFLTLPTYDDVSQDARIQGLYAYTKIGGAIGNVSALLRVDFDGSDKIRGVSANTVMVDEYAAMPKYIYSEIIK